MTTLVVGATGATGKHLVDQLLANGQKVKAIVRITANIPDHWKHNDQLTIIEASISELSVDEMAEHLKDCRAVASCLGHNLTLKGVFGKPRKLVRDAADLLCEAIKQNAPEAPVKLVLMNTTANRNRDIKESISTADKLVVSLIRLLIPPQSDNENAADLLRMKIGQANPTIEWVAVRPDTLIDEDQVSEYMVHATLQRSAVFKPGKTSRINVGHFMSDLIVDDQLWNTWKGQMPVIYNCAE